MFHNSKLIIYFSTLFLISGCTTKHDKSMDTASQIIGTWELITGTIIENGDTTITDYTENIRLIKIINETHFTFLNHDLNKGADSTATFVAGGGRYSLEENRYKENLEYCNFREWEGNDFEFEITIKNDTLIQQGIEKIEDLNVERLNIEVYKKVK